MSSTALGLLLLPFGALGLLSREERKACPYYQASGCILDQMEKACEGEAEEMMTPSAGENVWMCCCPSPYIACTKEEADSRCMKTAKDLSNSRGGQLDQNGLLEFRAALLATEPSCEGYVHRDAKDAVCGEWPKKMPELMCEMLTWQWEELGDGNQPEFDQYSCPMSKEHQAKNGQKRKRQALKWDPRKTEL